VEDQCEEDKLEDMIRDVKLLPKRMCMRQCRLIQILRCMLVQISSQGCQRCLRLMNLKAINGWIDKSLT